MAERKYAEAVARIGIAKADFYPHFYLGGFVGFLSGRTNDFGSSATSAWSLSPTIRWAGPNIARLKANLAASQARADAAQITYERTVLYAIEDIDSAVAGFNKERERLEDLFQENVHSSYALDLTRKSYKAGATSYLELLTAQRNQFAIEDGLVRAEMSVNVRGLALYKAVGGGWQLCRNEDCVAEGSSSAATSP
jgi:multidrug efflux system outer membrane protein